MNIHPGESTRFIGRRNELSEVRHLLAASRVVTLTGIGGAGKTRIARRLTTDLASTYPDGTWMVELADLLDPALLGHTVAGELGLQVQSGEWDLALVTDFLQGRRALITLDNCEHLSEACADLVVALLEACPDLEILTTSRQPLGIAGEAIFQVPPLSVPDPDRLPSLAALGQVESVALFVERATTALPSFRLDADNAVAVARLVRALEGVPLALELAAARIRMLSPDAMLARLNDRYRLLSRGYRDAPARQQSLMASVDWSFDLCTPQERVLWSRLAVFTGGFELDAAEVVCAGHGLDRHDILDLVASLLDKSVLLREGEVSPRYRMLETIRQYGVAKLEAAGDLERWRLRHRNWYAGLAARSEIDWVGPDQMDWVERLSAEHPNLRAALEHAVADAESAPVALRMCHSLEQYWICSGRLSEARRWCERALAHGTGTDAERSLAMRLCVWFGSLQMDLDYAQAMLVQAEPLARGSGDDVAWGYHLYGAGMLATWQSEVERGVPLLLEGIDVFRRARHRNGEVNLLFLTGMCLAFAGEAQHGSRLNQECIAITAPRQELFMRSYSLWSLGLDALAAGDLELATRLEFEGLTMKWAVKDRLGIALITEAIAWIAAAQNDGERAAKLLGAADAVWRVIGMSLTALPYISERRMQGENLARSTLSPRAFSRAFALGADLSLEGAVDLALGREATSAPDDVADSPLTPREGEVAELIGEGLTNREIAARLVISQRTATGHVENILRKLGFSSRAQVAAWVVERRVSSG